MTTVDGKTPFYKKWWFWLIIVVVIIGTGAAVTSSNKDPKKVGESSASSAVSDDESSSQPDKKQSFKVGDVVAIDGQEITILSVERNFIADNQYIHPKDGKEFIKLNLQIKNTSEDKIDYNALYWTVEDPNGDLINYNSALLAQPDDSLGSGQLAADGNKKASLVFEVPKDEKQLKVHFKPNILLDREAIIEL